MSQLAGGDPAPDFALPDAQGRTVRLRDFAGQSLVLYFYPAAMTPGCTTEATDFSGLAAGLGAAGYAVAGVSPDSVDKLQRFRAKYDLQVQLLSDPQREVISAYGAWGSRVIWGKTIEGVIRSTFVLDVDAAGVATVRLAEYNVRAAGHAARLYAELGLG